MTAPRRIAVALAAVAALVLAGCSGDEEPQGGATTSEVVTTGAVTDTTAETTTAATGAAAETGATTQPADLRSAAESISAELDATLSDVRDVDSLDELRDDLDNAVVSVQSWQDELAAAPEDEELVNQRDSLEEALARLQSSFDDLSASAQDADVGDLGTLAQKLGPDALAGIRQVRTALEAIVERPESS